MWWIVQTVYSFLYNSALEFVFFLLIDIVAKRPLKEARNESEKRAIWLYESLFLGVASVVVHLLDHKPYLLICLSVLTFVYTQLYGRVNFLYWWRLLKTRWDEHQHHAENVKAINQHLQNVDKWCKECKVVFPKPEQKSIFTRLYNYIFKSKINGAQQIDDVDTKGKQLFQFGSGNTVLNNINIQNQQRSQNFRSTSTYGATFSDSGFTQPSVSSGLVSGFKQHGTGAVVSQTNTGTVLQQTSTNISPKSTTTSSWFNRNDLKRKPLRNVQHFPSPVGSFSGTSQKLRNRFMSAIGFSGFSSKPSGLKNEGQNLCFLNCVVQCLARSPNLVEKLNNELSENVDCSVAESVLVTTLVELMSKCRVSSGRPTVLDPLALREAVSVLQDRLVVNPHNPAARQQQQDAGEFYMWLIEALHSILNKKLVQGDRKDRAATNPGLSMLNFIYGDLTPDRVHSLKEACRKEISNANGLDNDSYAEPIQRLSDLEWLTYKQNNDSCVDSQFTGQLVEAYHCLTDNHLSVSTQTFNILPVPIVAPRDVSGLVFLEDCFTKFCNIEHLIGKDGLECSFCNNKTAAVDPGGQRTPVLPGHSKSGAVSRGIPGTCVDSAVHSPIPSTFMSPIAGHRDIINDSGFHDNVFKTSTPIGEPQINFTFPTQRLRDAQRRCLLRQLPDCLVIQLLRFTYNQFSQQSRKINAPISIPLTNLDMTSIVYDKVTNREDLTASVDSYKYDLYGVCLHLGAESTHYGHYICYCKSDDGTWYKFDDDLVWDVNMEYEITTREIRENAYLLFYKRSTATQPSS